MTEAVTLELPEEVLRQAREVARHTRRRLADVLTEWLSWGAASDGRLFLVPEADYPLYTPYGNESAAQGLLDACRTEETVTYGDQPGR